MHMRAEMQQAGYDNITIATTGGAAPNFASQCECSMQLHDRLVLQGLVRVGETAMAQLRS